MLFGIILVLLCAYLVYFIQKSHQLIDQFTNRIERPWLKTTLRITVKIVVTTALVFGFLSTLLMAFVMQYDGKKGRKN